MVALLLALALAADDVDPLAEMSDVEITGWSADETRFSVRAFWRAEASIEADPVDCPGYVDQKGKKFSGRLVLAAYERGKLVESWVVQDYPRCTDPDRAKENLAAAKAKFAELGIDLKARGAQLDCARGCDLKHGGAKLQVENTTKVRKTSDEQAVLTGELRVWLLRGATRTKLHVQPVEETYQLYQNARMSAGVEKVQLSPTGKAFYLRAYTETMSGRGNSVTELPLGFFEWSGDNLEKK